MDHAGGLLALQWLLLLEADNYRQERLSQWCVRGIEHPERRCSRGLDEWFLAIYPSWRACYFDLHWLSI